MDGTDSSKLPESLGLPENLSPSITGSLPPQPHVVSALWLHSPSLTLSLSLCLFLAFPFPPPPLAPSLLPFLPLFLFLLFLLSLSFRALSPFPLLPQHWFLQCVLLMNSELRHPHVLIICCSLSLSLSFFRADQETEAALCLENRNH